MVIAPARLEHVFLLCPCSDVGVFVFVFGQWYVLFVPQFMPNICLCLCNGACCQPCYWLPIGSWEATTIRNKEVKVFEASEKELVDAIDTLDRALTWHPASLSKS